MRIRLRLRTVLLVVSLFTLVLPVAGIQILRLYESALVRQTESELIGQAAFVAAMFLSELRGGPLQTGSVWRPRFAELDLTTSPVGEPFPDGLPGPSASPEMISAGKIVTPILKDAQGVTLAGIRVVDANGTIVATTGDDLNMNILHGEEIRAALAGQRMSNLRQRSPEVDQESMSVISRNTAIRVFVADPIIAGEDVIGAVLLSRTPSNIVRALSLKKTLLIQASLLILLVVLGIALFTTRTLVKPIERLVEGAKQIASGAEQDFARHRPYRTIELDQLSKSVAAMAASLQQRTNYVRDFARHVSHEFKTPLTGLSGAIEVMDDHNATMSVTERKKFLSNMAEDVKRLERLTKRLLDLAHADMKSAANHRTYADEVLKNCPKFGLQVDYPADFRIALAVEFDAAQDVFSCLFENAAQLGATQAHISVVAAESSGTVVLRVTDDGPGISPANRQKIFDPFFTTRRDEGGTGLGLSIARALLVNAGGGISLDEESAATTFLLSFRQHDDRGIH